MKDELDKKNKEIEAILIGISSCGKDETLLNELKKQLKERNEEIMKLQKEILRLTEEINSLKEEIMKLNQKIAEKDRTIQELIAEKNEACEYLNRIYNYYNNGRITSVEFLQNIKNFIEQYCETELPRDRSSIPLPHPSDAPLPLPIPSYRKPTESSVVRKDPAGGKIGRSYDGSKKKRSKKVLKNSPRRSRKLKRSYKKKSKKRN